MIDRSLNYGRLVISSFLETIAPYGRVLDLGAGHGDDLSLAVAACPKTEVHAVEVYDVYARELQTKGWKVHCIDIERDKFPFATGSLDVIIANQILEHVKEVFWIFDQMSRSLKVGGGI